MYIERVNVDLNALGGFDWDRANASHTSRHGLPVEEVEQIFFRDPEVVEDPSHSGREPRWRAFAETDEGRLVVCVFTVRHNRLRPISARYCNARERKRYEDLHQGQSSQPADGGANEQGANGEVREPETDPDADQPPDSSGDA